MQKERYGQFKNDRLHHTFPPTNEGIKTINYRDTTINITL